MGENEKLGFLSATTPWVESGTIAATPWTGNPMPSITDGIGLDMSGNPIFKPNTSCGTIPQLSATDALRLESTQADKLMQEIFESSQKPIELLSEETAQQINKAFENIRKTMEKDFPMAFAKRKARKHYKPKFTL